MNKYPDYIENDYTIEEKLDLLEFKLRDVFYHNRDFTASIYSEWKSLYIDCKALLGQIKRNEVEFLPEITIETINFKDGSHMTLRKEKGRNYEKVYNEDTGELISSLYSVR